MRKAVTTKHGEHGEKPERKAITTVRTRKMLVTEGTEKDKSEKQ
jgi:hypothetical protein